jgi:RNA polymerase sigma-70 factor (ECF subfamily)
MAASYIQARLALSDSELIARARDGDDAAFDGIVRRYQDFVYRQAWIYLQDDEAARDAAQEVFVAAYEGIAFLRNESALRPWLYRICRNHCLNVIRRRNLERTHRPEALDRTQQDLPLRLALTRAIYDLDELYREVVILRYYQDLKYEEIARVLDISVDTVKVRLFRAKEKLRKMLGENR